MKIKIHSVETLGLVDGPGIRVVIFMQGCPLKCIFCHNPDTWSLDGGMELTPEELLNFILKYKNYFGHDGGVTFSGGEPLLQKEVLLEVLKLCKQNNINTCLDTAGSITDCDEILKYTDLVILDVKALTEENYLKITNSSIKPLLHFLDICHKLNKKIWIRQVIIPEINDTEESVDALVEFIKPYPNIEKIELLPYHNKAIYKYQELGITYPLKNTPNMDREKLNKLIERLPKL